MYISFISSGIYAFRLDVVIFYFYLFTYFVFSSA